MFRISNDYFKNSICEFVNTIFPHSPMKWYISITPFTMRFGAAKMCFMSIQRVFSLTYISFAIALIGITIDNASKPFFGADFINLF